MAKLTKHLCEMIVYPTYQNYALQQGTILSPEVLYADDLKDKASLVKRARAIVLLNGYYACLVRYNSKELAFISNQGGY